MTKRSCVIGVVRMLLVAGVLLAVAGGAPGRGDGGGNQPGTPDLDLYVAIGGNDASSCKSPQNSCRTIQAAIDRIPMILDRQVNISIQAGTYFGSVRIADRMAPRRFAIELIGQGEGATIAGGESLIDGVTVTRTMRVVLRNLTIRDFRGHGVVLRNGASASILQSGIVRNSGHGALVRMSDLTVADSAIGHNGEDGLSCEQGRLRFGATLSGQGVHVHHNERSGVLASACMVGFGGPAVIERNDVGLVSQHGAVIDVGMRSDVQVVDNFPASTGGGGGDTGGDSGGGRVRRPNLDLVSGVLGCQMLADCHGMITNFGSSTINGECDCEERDYGVCRAS